MEPHKMTTDKITEQKDQSRSVVQSARIPFYDDPLARAALVKVATSWVGTRFHARVTYPGLGANCVGMLHQIAIELGVPGAAELELPTAPMRYHEFNPESLIAAFMSQLVKKKRIRKVEEGPLMPGDYLGVEVKLTEHHLAQVVDAHRAIHVDRAKGVLFINHITRKSRHFVSNGPIQLPVKTVYRTYV